MIEPLEQRKHLSATLTGNVLTIVGTTRSDDIAIAAGRETFVVHDNGTQTAFTRDRSARSASSGWPATIRSSSARG